MKSTFLHLLLCLIFTFSCFTGFSQVTITADNYPRGTSFNDEVRYVPFPNISLPSEGDNQVWDYSDLPQGEPRSLIHYDATSDPDLPGMLNFFDYNFQFQGFFVPSITFEAIDDQGWYEAGRETYEIAYPIGAITGGVNDTLRFVHSKSLFEGRIDFLHFPVSYQSQWEQSFTEYFNYELTVAGFGLNNIPGYFKRNHAQVREMVGQGQLIIPKEDGSPSNLMDVLLLKVVRTQQDSVFLGGAPAPPPLMAAFGLEQGTIRQDSFYTFYRPGFGAVALNINMDGNLIFSAFYRPQAAELSTATDELVKAQLSVYPNPVRAGEALYLDFPEGTKSSSIVLYNAVGQRIHQEGIDDTSRQVVEYQIPPNLPTGTYFYQLSGHNGGILHAGQLQVR